jgi:hypothetical protein
MDMYGMQVDAETRREQRIEGADTRRMLRAAREGSGSADGSGRSGSGWRRWVQPGTNRPSAPSPEAS